ncbi:MAG: thiamine phosphate synthase [Pseudomonadota bacterium]
MSAARPVVLAIAGSEATGVAGIAVDLRVLAALGVHGAAAITANTAQGGEGAARNPVAPEVLDSQLAAAAQLAPRVVKTGLLADAGQVERVARFCARHQVALVCDPVLHSSTGMALTAGDTLPALRDRLLPLVGLLTPNLAEAEALTGIAIRTAADVECATRALRALGAAAVLIKGGHGGGDWSSDYLLAGEQSFWLHSPRLPAADRRGTGCALAAAAAAALALGYGIADAAVIAKAAVNQGLRQGYPCGDRAGPVHIDRFPDATEDLPALTPAADYRAPAPFPDCNAPRLGLYPIVERAAWLARLLSQGVSTIQLRVKDLQGAGLRAEIRAAIALARAHRARLFVNDYWRIALEEGAYGVHLGQDDLREADVEALRAAGLRLGVSTHCHWEAARAHALRPSYVACGPIYETTAKAMPWVPHGLAGLRYWRRLLADYPLVAIGGIDAARAPGVADTGVDGVAMISGITRAADPEATARQLVALLDGR